MKNFLRKNNAILSGNKAQLEERVLSIQSSPKKTVWPVKIFNRVMSDNNFGYLTHTTTINAASSILNDGTIYSSKMLEKLHKIPKSGHVFNAGDNSVVYMQLFCKAADPKFFHDPNEVMFIFDKKLLNSRNDYYANFLWEFGDRTNAVNPSHVDDFHKINCKVLNEVMFPNKVDLLPFLIKILIWKDAPKLNVPKKFKKYITIVG